MTAIDSFAESETENAPVVTLTGEEIQLAAMVGCLRQTENLKKGRRDAYGAEPEKGWSYHVEGAAGEMAFAKWANKFWSGNLGNLKADDVGKVQIRTRARHDWQLILHEQDPDDRIFVLITGMAPVFRLRGWIWGADGKRKEYWCDPSRRNRPAFFVPNKALHPMRTSPNRSQND